MKNNKKPSWVLFEQLHVNVEIKPIMTAQDRAELRKKLNGASFKRGIINNILIGSRTSPAGVRQVKVTITK